MMYDWPALAADWHNFHQIDFVQTELKEVPAEQLSHLAPDRKHYRTYVGGYQFYDMIGAVQFNLLTTLGLREHSYLLDIGCGSLRAGRMLIPYLLPGHYFGIEPEQWVLQEGIRKELGEQILDVKHPTFDHNSEFNLSVFDQQFDFLLAMSIFSHASQAQITKCLMEAKKVLKQDGIFAATYWEGEESYTGEEWVYPDCCFYRPEDFAGLVEAQGLVCQPIEWDHPHQRWVLIYRPDIKRTIPDLNNVAKLAALEAELKQCKAHMAEREQEFASYFERDKLVLQLGTVQQWAAEMEQRLLRQGQTKNVFARLKGLISRQK